MQLTENTILITGGGSGIGLELAAQLLQRGNTVIITGRDTAKLEAAKRQYPKIHAIRSDASDPRAILALYSDVIEKFPALNILVNNAGIMKRLNLHSDGDDLSELTQEVETNLNGPIRMARTFLPHLKTRPYAAIVNVSSGLAFVPLPVSPVYCATKAALHSFSLSLRVQLKNTKIKVFELAPPATETTLLGSFDKKDLEGTSVMPVSDMVKETLAGMEGDVLEIAPGQAKLLRFMSRLAPNFILRQLSKPVDRMLAAN